jgi:uncharacterized protein YaaQ
MGGSSTAIAKSEQTANANLMQSYSGTCNITCENKINQASITLINDEVGGDVFVSQVCAVNGHCAFNTSQNALVDILFKAANSAQANSAGQFLQAWNTTFSDSESYQDININVQQTIDQNCKISSVNYINDTNIFAANSVIGGNVYIQQKGTSYGGCTLQSIMAATEKASGIADECAAGGKGKKTKKSCSGKGGKSVGSYILYIGGGLVLFVIIMAAVRYFKGKQDQKPSQLKPGEASPTIPLNQSQVYDQEQVSYPLVGQELIASPEDYQIPEHAEDISMQNFDVPYMEPVVSE